MERVPRQLLTNDASPWGVNVHRKSITVASSRPHGPPGASPGVGTVQPPQRVESLLTGRTASETAHSELITHNPYCLVSQFMPVISR